MEGIFIPTDFFKIKEINNSERIVLSLYKYFTEKGKYKCCSMSNLEIGEVLGMSRRNIIEIKNHLKELGLITTTNGKTVFYVGKRSEEEFTSGGEVQFTQGEAEFTTGGEEEFTQGEAGFTTEGEEEFTPKVKCASLINVKKKKEEIKKEYKEEFKNNFERIMEKLPPYYKTEDKIAYLNNNYATWIEKVNKNEEIDTNGCVSQIKNVINHIFGTEESKIDVVKKKRLESMSLLKEQFDGFCYIDDSSYSKENTFTENRDLKDRFFNG